MLSSKSNRAVVPSIFGFPRISYSRAGRPTSGGRRQSHKADPGKLAAVKTPRVERTSRKRAAAGEGREAWLRNSIALSTRPSNSRDPGLSSFPRVTCCFRLSVRFFCRPSSQAVSGRWPATAPALQRSGSTAQLTNLLRRCHALFSSAIDAWLSVNSPFLSSLHISRLPTSREISPNRDFISTLIAILWSQTP